MLSMRELSRVYRTDTVETTALDRIDLDIADGEFVAIMGPSGCGKSTLLNVIGMLDSPDQRLLRLRRHGGGRASRGQARQRPQAEYRLHLPELQPGRRAAASARISSSPCSITTSPASERRSRVEAVMDKVGVAHRAKHRPSQLSGGQQQRVAVARALVGNPKLILADEPTGNLDTQHGEEVMKMLQALNREGSTIVMVTHSPAHADYAGRVVNMLDGRILIERRRAA